MGQGCRLLHSQKKERYWRLSPPSQPEKRKILEADGMKFLWRGKGKLEAVASFQARKKKDSGGCRLLPSQKKERFWRLSPPSKPEKRKILEAVASFTARKKKDIGGGRLLHSQKKERFWRRSPPSQPEKRKILEAVASFTARKKKDIGG